MMVVVPGLVRRKLPSLALFALLAQGPACDSGDASDNSNTAGAANVAGSSPAAGGGSGGGGDAARAGAGNAASTTGGTAGSAAGGTTTTAGSAAGGTTTTAGSTAGGTRTTGGSTAGGSPATAGSTTGGSTASGDDTSLCDDPNLVWKTARKTNYTSYPEPGSEECIEFNGCMWEGLFAACNGKKSEEWVASHNIAAVFPDFGELRLHDLCLRQGTKRIVVTVLDTCGDSDCDGCCTRNKGDADLLIDLESYTNERWGVPDGRIEWADLGPTRGSGCD